MTNAVVRGDKAKEGIGWLTLVFMLLLFPALFFAVVFVPIWLGITPRW